jgi:hypothetical protein
MKRIFTLVLVFSAVALFAVQDTDFSMTGAVLKEKKNGTEIWQKDDGTIITIFSDRAEAIFPNGSKIIKYNGGRREVISGDGKKIVIDDSKGIREYSDAKSSKKIDFQGRTPFGEQILKVEKQILKDPRIRIIYIPEKSDEMLYPEKTEEKVDWEIKSLFDDLYDSLRQKYINDAQNKKYYTGKPFDVQVSFCRYCKTGYCFDKQKQVTVEVYEEDTVIKSFILESIMLRDKAKSKAFIKDIVAYVESK